MASKRKGAAAGLSDDEILRIDIKFYKVEFKHAVRSLRLMREISEFRSTKRTREVGQKKFVLNVDMLSSVLKHFRKNIDILETSISNRTYDARLVTSALGLGIQLVVIRKIIADCNRIIGYRRLKPFTPAVSDEQILQVRSSGKYPTDREQAERLGISERTLYRRLKKIKGEFDA